ncbi:MAG: hypothetical protein HY391_00800 [Deltaproteobacteria bacterium]|nr:hypothetical protein [Deltaproteobacteria bacterium]
MMQMRRIILFLFLISSLLEKTCVTMNKKNCYVVLVPGLGHGFSRPKGPRRHPLLDLTIGPIDQSFLELLTQMAKEKIVQ